MVSTLDSINQPSDSYSLGINSQRRVRDTLLYDQHRYKPKVRIKTPFSLSLFDRDSYSPSTLTQRIVRKRAGCHFRITIIVFLFLWFSRRPNPIVRGTLLFEIGLDSSMDPWVSTLLWWSQFLSAPISSEALSMKEDECCSIVEIFIWRNFEIHPTEWDFFLSTSCELIIFIIWK